MIKFLVKHHQEGLEAALRFLIHLMLLFFQSSGLCVQSPSIIPVPGYPGSGVVLDCIDS